MIRIIKLRRISPEEKAEVVAWLCKKGVAVAKASSMDDLLRPNHIRPLDIHKYSKQQQLKLKIASWKNYSEMLEIQHQMALNKKAIRKLAARSVGAADSLFYEFMQIEKEQKLAKIRRAKARREEVLKAEQAEQAMMVDNSSSEEDDAKTVVLAQTLEDPSPMKSEKPNLASEKFDDIKSAVVDGSGDGVPRPPMIAYARYLEVLRASNEKDTILESFAKQLEEQLRNLLPTIGDQPQEDFKAADSAEIRK